MVCGADQSVKARRLDGTTRRSLRPVPRRLGVLLVALLLNMGGTGSALAQDATNTVTTPAANDDPIFIPAVPWLEKAEAAIESVRGEPPFIQA